MSTVLRKLLEHLPADIQGPDLLDAAAPNIRYIDAPRGEFVEPALSITSGDFSSAQVVVVSAPAAVGKTMLAEHLAYRSGAAFWDLAGFLLGDNFAIGTLASAHGQPALGEALKRLREGSFAIVADALDEARLRVSFDAYTAFLSDLSEQILKDSTSGHPPFVLLARAETAELAVEWLKESEVGVAALKIDFFDREQAHDFVDRQIAAANQNPSQDGTARAKQAIFAQALTLFDVDAEAETWPDDARRFLGYAPVLVAISRYLVETGNPQRIVEQFSSSETPEGLWKLLIALIDGILEREQQKFLDGFRGSLDADLAAKVDFSGWQDLFGPSEQRVWLLHRVLGTAPPDLQLPAELEGVYRTEVRGWLPEHPFVGTTQEAFASPVFEDYVYAQALLANNPQAKAGVRQRVAAAAYRPTELLARFLFATGDGKKELEVADLPALYESLAAAQETGEEMWLQLSDEEGELEVAIDLGDESIELILLDDGSPISFTRGLGRASISLNEHMARLGNEDKPFELGPEVALSAPEIEIAAESLLIRHDGKENEEVILSADSILIGPPQLRVDGSTDGLHVKSKGALTFPLVNHRIEMGVEEPLGQAELDASQVLFRVLSFFKSEGYKGLGAHIEPIDRRARRNQRFGEMLSYAMSRGLISKEKKIYRLHPEILGIDFLKVRVHIITPETAKFLRDFASEQTQV